MRRAVLCLAAAACFAQGPSPQTLADVARIASVMVDGDLCTSIQTARSVEYSPKHDSRDRWRASDNYDVNAVPFIQTKKTLIRLARLCPAVCDLNLWMPVASRPDRIQVVIRNVHELSQFWTWGQMDQPMPPEMERVLNHAERVTVRLRPGMTSVLAPVYDTVGNVVALVEVVSETNPDPRENVK